MNRNRQQTDVYQAFDDLRRRTGRLERRNMIDDPAPDTTSGGGVPVQVTGTRVGDEHTYTVSIYADGPTETATSTGEDGYCMQISSSSPAIPTGTWAIATEIDGVYYFQVPIWL